MQRRAARAPDRPRLRRRRALEHRRTSQRADRSTAAERGVDDLVIHAFTDGRDTLAARGRAATSRRSQGWCARPATGARSASVIGRYFAMDRDKRWDRVQKAYDLLVHGVGRAQRADRRRRPRAPPTSAARPTSSSRRRLVGDGGARSAPATPSSRSTSAPTACARSRCALAEPGCDGIDRRGAPPIVAYTTLTEYDGGLARTRSPSRRSARRSRCRASSPPPAAASCTSRRPRSTRT